MASSTPALNKRRGASKARASKSDEKVVWYGGENNHQDVCIRLVRLGDDRTLATLMVHSSRLEACGSYFAAAQSQSWKSNRKRSSEDLTQHVTFHVDGDVRLYTDCVTRMYKPFMVGFKSVIYSLQLLEVATQLAYDDLMSSICTHLAAAYPWSDEDEMRIRSSMLSEGFPRGHAQDLIELLERPLTRDDLRPLITRCMSSFRWGKIRRSSITVAKPARSLLIHLLKTARGQERSLTPTFEQEAVGVLIEEFKLLVVEADAEVETSGTMQGNPDLITRLATVQQVLDLLLVTRMADEPAKWFGQFTSFPKLMKEALASDRRDDDFWLADDMIWTAVKMVMYMCRHLHLKDSLRDSMLLNWLPFLYWVRRNTHAVVGVNRHMNYLEEYKQVQEVLYFITPSSEELKQIVDKVRAP